MAHVIKQRARKPFAAAECVNVGYGNYSLPLMSERKHISLRIGDILIRIEMTKAVEAAREILRLHNEYGDKTNDQDSTS